jgi:hypothetical protein
MKYNPDFSFLRRRWTLMGILVGLLALALTACSTTNVSLTALPTDVLPTALSTPVPTEAVPTPTLINRQTVQPPMDTGDSDKASSTNLDQPLPSTLVQSTAVDTLSDAEIEGILYMREEEKLARDVYLTLYETWGISIFQNIAKSESTHMDAVKTLIERYDLVDPAQDKGVGVFDNATLQQLYDQLVAQGSQSLGDALRVGAAIEEIDILDLQAHIAETSQADIQSVYENLLAGSYNHLRSFASTLSRQTGETYQPQYLDQDAYEAIVSESIERGRGRGRGRGS